MSLLKNDLKISLFGDLKSFNVFTIFYKKKFEKTCLIIALLLLKILAIFFVRGLLDEASALILINSI